MEWVLVAAVVVVLVVLVALIVRSRRGTRWEAPPRGPGGPEHAGAREPRRPVPSGGAQAVAVEPDDGDRP